MKHSCRPALVIVALSMTGLSEAIAADADIEKLRAELRSEFKAETNALKATYEKKIQGLENRISSLEGDNKQLREGAPATVAAPPPTKSEIASMNKRLTKLESASGKPSPTAVAAAEQAS